MAAANQRFTDTMRSLADMNATRNSYASGEIVKPTDIPQLTIDTVVDGPSPQTPGSSRSTVGSPHRSGVTLATFRGHHVSSPRHLKHSPKSISSSIALRQDSSKEGRDESPLSPVPVPRAHSASLVLRQSSFGTFEGFSVESQHDTSINCIVSAPCTPDSRAYGSSSKIFLDLSNISPKENIRTFQKQDVFSPAHLRHSPKSIAAALLLRKQALADYSPYKSVSKHTSDLFDVSVEAQPEWGRNLDLLADETLFDIDNNPNDILRSVMFQPKPIRKSHPNIERVIRNPVSRLQHGNKNYFDTSSQTWKSAVSR